MWTGIKLPRFQFDCVTYLLCDIGQNDELFCSLMVYKMEVIIVPSSLNWDED